MKETDLRIDGVIGQLLGFAYGLQYNPYKPGKYYDAVETSILSYNAVF